MNSLSNHDKKLLDRLNALRPSTLLSDAYDCTSFRAKVASELSESSIIRSQFKNTENDLSIRLRKLRNASSTTPEISGNTSSSITLKQESVKMDTNLIIDQLVSEKLKISPGQISPECEKLTEFDNKFTEISSVQIFLKKTEKFISIPSLKLIEPEQNEIVNEDLICLLDNMPFDFELDEDDKQYDKLDDNEQIIAQMDLSCEVNDVTAQVMDVVSLEQQYLLQQVDDKNISQGKNFELENEELVNMPVFPSIPTSLNHPKENFNSFSKIHANQTPEVSAEPSCGMNSMDFMSCQLPAKPIFQPTKIYEKDLKDSDIDTWCIICQEDARIRCLSCDGDLYCEFCWEEGHNGSDAGLEERNHRWVTYKRK